MIKTNLVAPGIAFIERLMVDSCIIERDAQRYSDDVLDEETGRLIPPAFDTSTTYAGKCIFTAINRRELEFERGGEQLFRKLYRVLIPVDVIDIEQGDTITATAVGPDNDQWLIGKPMRVSLVEGGSYQTCRRLHVELIVPDNGAPLK